MPAAAPERPIQSHREDRLGREGFIRRLTGTLINESTGKSTGVVIGVAGPWGSGKSSLLNILNEHILTAYPQALVVRFDPWLVSGRDDLVGKFISEITGTINARPSPSRELTEFAKLFAEYGAQLSPVAELAQGGLAPMISGALRATQKALTRDSSLFLHRQKIDTALAALPIPVVILIDELDRVSDIEVKTMAQLVRSIADFPGLSYVLAYDAQRVIQALGGGDDIGAEERGRSYLEKIVQLQIPLPITLPNEIERLIISELVAIEAHMSLPENWQDIDRFRTLIEVLVPEVVSTPRDVKRLVGTYHAVGGMVRGEVDWIGLLGFCALLVKAPKTVENIRRNPDRVVDDPESFAEQSNRVSGDTTVAERMAAIKERDEGGEGIGALLAFLFPSLSESGTPSEDVPDAICLRLPLWKTLRLGLLPEEYSKPEILSFLRAPTAEMKDFLRAEQRKRSLDVLLDRLGEWYLDFDRVDHARVWSVLGSFAEKANLSWTTSYDPTREYARNLVGLFSILCARSPQFRELAPILFREMLTRGDLVLPSNLVRYNIFAHGLFRHDKRGSKGAFLAPEETVDTARMMSRQHVKDLLAGKLLPRLMDLTPCFNMVDLGEWDAKLRGYLTAQLDHNAVLDSMILWLYGGPFKTDRNAIGQLVNLDAFASRLRKRIAEPSLGTAHETVRLAYRKAVIAMA
jgi:hypothetical protein